MTTPVEQRMVEVLDAEVVGTEVELAPPANLFRADNPAEVIERATEVANTLKGVLDKQGLTKNIQGRSHVLVEGWTTCGAMLGVVPVVVWTRQVENGWEARTEARTLDGRVVGAAEASCTRDERTWSKREDYALRSMAQTRATSKALRGPLGFIVTLAGYAATPAEEMPHDEPASSPQSFKAPVATDAMMGRIYSSADARKLPNRTLANIILAATGNPEKEWADEEQAGAWIGRAAKRIPEDRVARILAAITKAGT